jgi:D-3-phosphoglycerate dehydrogenase
VRILNAEPEGYSSEARAVLSALGELVEKPVPQHQLAVRVQGFDALIVRLGLRVTREVLEAADCLQAVVTATTGLDHVDLEAADERGVAVLSLQGEREFLRTVTATAEHAWALLLALVRRIPWAFDSVRQGEWERDRFRGRELRGRRLGILGLGRVGEQVAGYGQAFGMSVGAHDPYRQGWVEGVRRFERLEELLGWSEVLSVHLPLDPTTQGLLNLERLALLPAGALVVNSARGAIIDEAALVTLLERGHLGGAAVDVLAEEQPPGRRQESPLLHLARADARLLITPHLGGAAADAMQRTELFMAEKLRRFLDR